MKTLTIGKMAKLNGISEQTLRLYDKMGLVVPCEINKSTGYRYYNIRQCAQLDMIQYLKSFNMTLAQIKDCFDTHSTEKLIAMLREQKSIVEKDIKELRQADWAIDRLLENYKRYDAAPEDNTPVLEFQHERQAFVYDTGINCYSYDMDYYENVLRDLKENVFSNDLPSSYFCNAGSILRKEHFDNGELASTELFVFVDDTHKNDENVETIPEGMYMCLYCNGFNNEEESLKKLMKHIKNQGYDTEGDCLSEVLIEFPVFQRYERKAFFKLQVPVRRKGI